MRFIFTILCSLVLLSSCARKINFNKSSVVPGATGKIKLKKDNNNNYHVDAEFRNLADPKYLQIPRQVYVLWMETDNNGTQNLGKVIPRSGIFSSAIKADLETVTSVRPTRFLITAEDDGTVQYPGSHLILQTNSF
jgi:hypothetical protein